MSLQDRIISLSEYSLSFETFQGNFVVAIAYKPNWKVRKPKNEKINFYVDDENKGVCYYEMPVGGDIEEIFECIDEVISHNKENEQKVELFKATVERLKILFKTEPLSVLETLDFKLKKKKVKKTGDDTTNGDTVSKIEENGASDENSDKPIELVIEPKKEENKPVVIDKSVEDKISAAINKKNKMVND